MKTSKKILIGAVVVMFLATVWLVRAATFSSIGSLVTVNNTTSNGTAFTMTTFSGSGTMAVQTAGLTATNALLVNDQISLDGTNYITLSTVSMSTTNAGSVNVYLPFSVPVYRRAQVVTTNSVQVGVTYQY